MAGRLSKQELGAQYIHGREKGTVNTNLELSAPVLFTQTKILVREQGCTQWPHCPTSCNGIKISPHKVYPETPLAGDLRFCQVDN